jgi:hypothetical protein
MPKGARVPVRASLVPNESGRAAARRGVDDCAARGESEGCSRLVWRSRSTDRNRLGEGGKIGETDFRVVEPYWFWTAWSP